MSDYLQRYLPEFDEEALREKLKGYGSTELMNMLIVAYKERRVFAKLADEERSRLNRIRTIVDEPSALARMPDVPGPDELKKMAE